MNSTTQYNRIAVVLHWLMAILIIGSLLQGTILLEHTPNSDPEKLSALQGHAIFGVIIGLLLILRYINLKLRNTPEPANPKGSRMAWMSSMAHKLIYLLILSVVGTGIAMGVEADFASLFAQTAAMPESFDTLLTRQAHNILTKLLILLLLAHIGAALFHQLVTKDQLMRRMRWKRFNQ
ncbi:MAG TPA: cytochrome B [Oceanospirillaceae bacterium]|nr:cytochrome B [Oceanospirillaceae bacterium]